MHQVPEIQGTLSTAGITPLNIQPNVNFRTGELHQTAHYIYNTADIIGKGSVAKIYFGRRKGVGDVVAVKVFASGGTDFMIHVQREREILLSLDHENIIKFINFETEEESGFPVIIMEYCKDGSLQMIMGKPENMFGLLEDELMIFFMDFINGIIYLREKRIFHRDIKPGNILRSKREDGRSIYKIADFGCARKLAADERYESICGTIHPAILSRDIHGESTSQMFDASADLWSTGETMYFAVAGKEPFSPFHGKADIATLHHMISEKPPDVISAVQNEENGNIVFSKSLSSKCQLPETLQNLIIDIIVHLFDVSHMLSFEQFFTKVCSIYMKIRITIFHCCTGHFIVIYMKDTDRYANLQDEIARITEIPASSQLLLVLNQELTELVNVTAEIKMYPKSVTKGTVFLYQSEIVVSPALRAVQILKFPDISMDHNLNDDARTARLCAAVACHICRTHEYVIDCQEHLVASLSNLRGFIRRIIWQSEKCLPDLSRCSDETQRRISRFIHALDGFEAVSVVGFGKDQEMKKLLTSFRKLIGETSFHTFQKKIEDRIEEIGNYTKVLSSKIGEEEAKASEDCVGCVEDAHCHERMEFKKQKIFEVADIFLRHSKYQTLHEHEVTIHFIEKTNLGKLCNEVSSIFHEHCKPNYHSLFETAMKYLMLLTKHLGRVRKVEKNVEAVIDSQKQISIQLGKFEEVCMQKMEEIKLLINKFVSPSDLSSQSATCSNQDP